MTYPIHTKVLIIGSGPAGYCAAIYCSRGCLEPILISGISKGGQLMTTTEVENYPGFIDPILGSELMHNMEQQSIKFGTRVVEDNVSSVNLAVRPFKVYTDFGKEYSADSIIIATGAVAKWLGIESEQKFIGYGVSACATCDGFFYKGKNVLVVGGGNTAVEEALYLTHYATKVTLVHRRNELKAEKVLQQRLFNNPKIEIIWDTVLDQVLGIDGDIKSVNGALLKNIKTNMSKKLDVSGIFIAIGHTPTTKLFVDQLILDNDGYIVTESNSTKTSITGVFAAGDVQDKVFRQAVTAAGSGCMAALEVEHYLNS